MSEVEPRTIPILVPEALGFDSYAFVGEAANAFGHNSVCG